MLTGPPLPAVVSVKPPLLSHPAVLQRPRSGPAEAPAVGLGSHSAPAGGGAGRAEPRLPRPDPPALQVIPVSTSAPGAAVLTLPILG